MPLSALSSSLLQARNVSQLEKKYQQLVIKKIVLCETVSLIPRPLV